MGEWETCRLCGRRDQWRRGGERQCIDCSKALLVLPRLRFPYEVIIGAAEELKADQAVRRYMEDRWFVRRELERDAELMAELGAGDA